MKKYIQADREVYTDKVIPDKTYSSNRALIKEHVYHCGLIVIFYLFFKFIYLRETDRKWERGRQRGREREFQEGSVLPAHSMMWGSNS